MAYIKYKKTITFGKPKNKSNDKKSAQNTKPCPKCSGTGRIKK